MLEALRKQSQSWLIWLALGIIIIVFVFFFGPQAGGFNPSTKHWVAKAGGERIFNTEVIATLDRYNRNVSVEMFEQAQRETTIDIALVNLLAAEARDAGLSISDNELTCYLVNWNENYNIQGEYICREFPRTYAATYPNLDVAFYTDETGNLSEDFDGVIRQWFAMNPNVYDEWKRRELLALRYVDVLSAGIPVPSAYTESQRAFSDARINLEFVRVSPSQGELPEPSADELARFAASAQADIAAAYEARIDEYTTPRQLRLSRIGIRKSGSEGDDEYNAAQARFAEALAAAREDGADFAAVVEEYTDFVGDKETGGDLGLHAEDYYNSAVWQAASSASVGDVVTAESEYSWNVIRIEEDVAERIQPLEEVRDQIVADLYTDHQREQLTADRRELATAVLEHVRENGGTFEEAIASLSPTPLVEEDAEPADDSNEEDNADAAVEADATAPEASVPTLEAQRTGEFALQPDPIDLSGIDPALRAQLGGALQISGRDPDTIPRVGASAALVHEAFSLTEDSPLIDRIVEVEGEEYLVRLADRTVNSEENADAVDAAATHAEFQFELSSLTTVRRRLIQHDWSSELPPILQDTLTRAYAEGDLKLRDEVFPNGLEF